MKRTLQIIGLLCTLFAFSACQADSEQEQETGNSAGETEETTEDNESDVAGDVSEEPEDGTDEDTSVNKDTDTSYEYEEQKIIDEEIAEGEYDISVETDNQGTRVMFYEIDGEKYYKTVFVKNDSRLKIIDLQNDDGLIYNETI
ncbi:hypothetical protein [Oceanobacillus sp. FSL W7-1281]|uniref:hypothetical protein n=1 Tax=Oceanobacillus TaxID=182709 RepID=UPI0030D8D9B0